MILKNCNYYDKDFNLTHGDIKISEGKFIEFGTFKENGDNMSDFVILPGFIDIHIHGCNNADSSNPEPKNVLIMSDYLVSKGVTSFCPTTMTVSEEELEKAFSNIKAACGNEHGAKIQGINMEGPFISKEKKGAQSEKHIKKPNIELFKKLSSICNVCIVDIAPEEDDEFKFTECISNISRVSMAHTCADYNIATQSFTHGISHTTHLFNAMTPFTSREPGAVGAVFDNDRVTAEMICDGIHIAPATLRTAFKILGENRTVVISDAMMAAGLKSGTYTLGGQKVIVKNDARLQDGTLAGSITNLFDEFSNLKSFGIPIKQIIKSLSINPAKVIGKEKEIGSIESNKFADFVVMDKNMEKIISVYVNGARIFEG